MAYGDGIDNGFGQTQDLYGNWIPAGGSTSIQGGSPQLQSSPIAVGGDQRNLLSSNPPQQAPSGTTSGSGSYGGGGGSAGGGSGAAAPAYNQADIDQLDRQQSLYERLLQSTGSTLNSGIQGLNDSTDKANQRANLTNDRAERDYGLQRESSQAAKNSAINSVDTNARTLSDSLRRIIGMAAGSGASANLAANNAVARSASQERGGVLGKFGENSRSLDIAEGDTETDFERLLEEIKASRRDQEESLRAGIGTQKQGINQSLAEIAAERARVTGGNQLSAAQPYQDRYLGVQDKLDALPDKFRNQAGRDVEVNAPKLSDYLVDRQAINASEATGQTQYSPYAAFLNRNREEEQRV